MTLAAKYNRILKGKLLHFAAWSPVTDAYEVGDFGALRRGVFQKLGNIREFGVDPDAQAGASATSFDFTSSGSSIVRVAGGATVDVFPNQPLEAKLEITFSSEEAFYIRTSKLNVTEMRSVDQIAQKLKGRRDRDGRRWKLRWRIVRKVYTAANPAILASVEKDTKFTLLGRADALKALELGNASAEIAVASSRQDALKIAGGTGPVAIDLFRVKLLGGAGLEAVESEDALESHNVAPELDDDWDPDEDDDA